MKKEIVDKWDQNKSRLEDVIRTTNMEYASYKTLVEFIVQYILNNPDDSDDWDNFKVEQIHEIDDGDYQGTLLFLIPKNRYQPDESEYLITYVNYGSCSGCDTLQAIKSYTYDGCDDGRYENQIKCYMTLCLHLIQNMKYLYEK